ncbi:MAG TPA: pitrilysin family protein [Acidobacteriota bacterium]|nr:pitrilysin family protein [Acidobacteriota bacterium]
MTAAIRKEILENGLTILTERIDHLRSISLGVWLKQGSQHETNDHAGVHHFLEHMLFKGTQNKSTYEIARIIDSIGGFTDAFTSKENTCFYAKVLDEHLPIMLELFSDILMYPKFDPEDIERERKVVLEEIKMVEDTPGDLVHELFLEHFWRNHPLGRPILGTAETVGQFDQQLLRDHFSRGYVPAKMMITAAGKIDHDVLVQAIRTSFAFGPPKEEPKRTGFMQISPEPMVILRPKKDLEQAHVCIGMMGYSANDPARYAASVLNVILGGGMSSRLFQRLREERGLCYTVYASMNSFLEAGYMSIYAGTSRENVKTAVELILQECRLLVTEPVSAEELENAKNHLKGNLILSLESSSTRMFNLARNDLYFQRQISTEELLEEVSRVSIDDVQHVAMELFQHSKYGIVVVGDLDDLDIRLEDFQIH